MARENDIQARAELLKSLMTCPICDKFMKNVTTICECLHSFCRKCIYKKISEEKLCRCPVCDTSLGCSPLEKLRTDHNWQDIRNKIVTVRKGKGERHESFKAEEDKEHEPIVHTSVPGRRKERYLSSLVNESKSSSAPSPMVGIRKPSKRKPGRTTNFSGEHPTENSISLTTPRKNVPSKKQPSDVVSPSELDFQTKVEYIKGDSSEETADLWKPLNCLLEAATMKKFIKSHSNALSLGVKPVPSQTQVHRNETNYDEFGIKGDDFSGELQNHYVNDKPTLAPLSSKTSTKKNHRGRPKKAVLDDRLNIRSQCSLVDAANNDFQGKLTPIWLTLVASDNLRGGIPLPQVPSRYLMIKDANLPVSSIQKYIVKKLGLQFDSEAEVEIYLGAEPIPPTLQLHDLLDLWCQSQSTPEKITTRVGSSAEDFVMVLRYCRKA